MNALTRWDPAKEMDEFQNRLAKFFGGAPRRERAHQPLERQHQRERRCGFLYFCAEV